MWVLRRGAGFLGIALAVLSSGCDGSTDQATDRDLYSLNISADGIRGGRTYADFDRLRDRESFEAFKGFGCLGSCDGHEAGYAWAKKGEGGDVTECGGNSWSFMEGCVAATLENDQADDRYKN